MTTLFAATTDPIGSLYLDARDRAKEKASGSHTSTADCGCQVSVTWVSAGCSTYAPERCHLHPVRRNQPA